MATLGRLLISSGERLDLPDLLSIDSYTSGDLKYLLSGLVGSSKPYVLKGFDIIDAPSAIQTQNCSIRVADSVVFYPGSSAGSFFHGLPEGNEQALPLTPELRKNATNYIYLTLSTFDTAEDTRAFWDPDKDGGAGGEFTQDVNTESVLQVVVNVSTASFPTNTIPIAKIKVGALVIESIEDCRNLLFRLGSGGLAPDPYSDYAFKSLPSSGYERTEPDNIADATSDPNPFQGGDKNISTLKEWMDAMMTSVKEIKGTEYWYSDNSPGSLAGLRGDIANTVFAGKGKMSHDDAVAGKINWSDDVYIKFIGGQLAYKVIANASSSDIVLSDDEVAYFKIVRDQLITPNLLWENGSNIVRSVSGVEWLADLVVGDWIKVASEDRTQYYQIQTRNIITQEVTLTENYAGPTTTVFGVRSHYSYGAYETNSSPSTDRHVKVAQRKSVPFDEDHFWFLFRSDNSGSTPKVYARFLASEIEQGESRDINDNASDQIFTFVGSTGETDTTPIYQPKLGTLIGEETVITLPSAAMISTGQYFVLNSARDIRSYYVWFNKDGITGYASNPYPPNKTPIEVPILSGDDDFIVAQKTATALATAAYADFTAVLAPVPGGYTVIVTNTEIGPCTDASNVDVGGSFSIATTTQGLGDANHYIDDLDNLTLSIKKLDRAIFENKGDKDPQAYEEPLDIVSGSTVDPNEYQGPVSAGTTLMLPPDSKDGDAVKTYTVGKGQLLIALNGQYLRADEDYSEIGSAGSQSHIMSILIDLVVGDTLEFRIIKNGSTFFGGLGEGEVNTASNLGSIGLGPAIFKQKAGVDLQFRRLSAGPGITLTQNADDVNVAAIPVAANSNVITVLGANAYLTVSDDIALISCLGADRTITLPLAEYANKGKKITIKMLDSGSTVKVKTLLNQTIDGLNCAVLNHWPISIQYESLDVISDGSSWWIV